VADEYLHSQHEARGRAQTAVTELLAWHCFCSCWKRSSSETISSRGTSCNYRNNKSHYRGRRTACRRLTESDSMSGILENLMSLRAQLITKFTRICLPSSHFFMINVNFTPKLYSTPGFSKWSVPSKISEQIFVCIVLYEGFA
jgi:hypothetical protein